MNKEEIVSKPPEYYRPTLSLAWTDVPAASPLVQRWESTVWNEDGSPNPDVWVIVPCLSDTVISPEAPEAPEAPAAPEDDVKQREDLSSDLAPNSFAGYRG